jgi:hypothetical protein
VNDKALREFLTGQFTTWSMIRAGRERPVKEDRELGERASDAAMATFSPPALELQRPYRLEPPEQLTLR